jgi:hypothetical protein
MLTRDAKYTEKGKYDSDQNSETAEFRSHSSVFSAEESSFLAPIYGAWNVGPMHHSQHRINKYISPLRPLRL